MVRDICTKMNTYYTERKFYNTFVTKISTGLKPTDILANTFHLVNLNMAVETKSTHLFLTRHLKGDDCLLRSMTILIITNTVLYTDGHHCSESSIQDDSKEVK